MTEKEAKKLLPSKGEVTVAKLSNKTFVYSAGGGNPVLFEHEDNLYPTVYALWQFPHMSPALLTYSEVSPKVIVGGADLMLPGVIVPDEGLGDWEVGDARGLRIPQSRFAFAVGRMLVGRAEAEASGMKGKGLGLLHHFPDALWAMGDKSVPHAGFTPERILPPPDGEEAAGGERKKKSKKDKKDRKGGSEGVGGEPEATEAAEELGGLALGDGGGGPDEGGAPSGAPAASMEELIDACFMRALRERVADGDLPLDCSKFYSGCMLPCRPAGVELDIKRSAYKKLSKLMKTMEKRGVISVKAIRKEDHILEVHRDCAAYTAAADAAMAAAAAEDAPGGTEVGGSAAGAGAGAGPEGRLPTQGDAIAGGGLEEEGAAGVATLEQSKAPSDLEYLQELIAIQSNGPKIIGFFGTRNMGFLHQQLIEILSYAMVLTENHIFTSGATGTNAAVIRGAVRAERPDLLTVVLPQSLAKQPPESQELLKDVQNVVEMPANDGMSLIEASRICNQDILSKVHQVICFAFHDSNLLLETCREAKELRKMVTLFYLD